MTVAWLHQHDLTVCHLPPGVPLVATLAPPSTLLELKQTQQVKNRNKWWCYAGSSHQHQAGTAHRTMAGLLRLKLVPDTIIRWDMGVWGPCQYHYHHV